MFDILELLGIARYDAFGQPRNPEEVINELIEKRDLLTWRVWHSLRRYRNLKDKPKYGVNEPATITFTNTKTGETSEMIIK